MSQPRPTPNPTSSAMNKIKNILTAGTAGVCSILSLYPVETLKTRIQMMSESGTKVSPLKLMKEMYRTEGIKTFYMGLGAAVMRQFLFASFRIGLFYNLSDYLKQKKNGKPVSIGETALASVSAGGTAILTVMPFDVVFVRMQAENSLPLEQRRGYTNMFNALSRISKEEGVGALWKGAIPAVARAMALNFGMLVPYEMCKSLLAPYLGHTYTNYIISSGIAGFGAAVCALPFDNAKVKLQKQTPGADGKLPYKGLLNCMGKTLAKEGLKGYWAGFLTFYSFIFPQTVMILLINDFLRITFGISKA
jgi:solute carrier family 25 oxoglutarate transporter 11